MHSAKTNINKKIESEIEFYQNKQISQNFFYLPVEQSTPVYPALQLQLYPLTRSPQVPCAQGLEAHSFISKLKMN